MSLNIWYSLDEDNERQCQLRTRIIIEVFTSENSVTQNALFRRYFEKLLVI